MKPPSLFFLLLAALVSPLRAEEPVQATVAFPGLTFSQPLGICPFPGSPSRLIIVEKVGKIQLLDGVGTDKVTKREIFDITAPRDGKFEQGGECGLLGVALHPDCVKNGQVFVYYSLKIEGKLHQRVSRFTFKDAANPVIDLASEQPLINQIDPAANHNGGDLHFGPDGYLYISCGDGGAGGDAFNNSGFVTKGFFAAVYRIDVDNKPGSLAPNPHAAVVHDAQGKAYYSVPSDNPFLGVKAVRGVAITDPASVRTEAWAIGLRNPWRFSFDPKGGRLFCGDVGQNLFEEIDILTPGGDFGWNVVEGHHEFQKKDASGKKSAPKLADLTGTHFIAPIHEYDRKYGNSVTGGVVYRGANLPSYEGVYIFADFSGRVYALRDQAGKWAATEIAKDIAIAGFGYDPSNGDVLFASLAGQVKRIVKK
jgi:glucose/arabinose dehydrogenase